MPDDVLHRLAGNGGVCMVTFVPFFVSPDCAQWQIGLFAELERRGLDRRDISAWDAVVPEYERAHPMPEATLTQVADHVEHVRSVAGLAHVGLGGDYDGSAGMPTGLADVSCYPALFAELLDRGWTEDECAALAGGNILRVLRDAENLASAVPGAR